MIKTSEVIDGINSSALEMLPEIVGCSREKILFIDIETTGLSPKSSDLYLIGTGFVEDGKWVLRTTVQALEGVGRFVIGLAADVKVVEGKKLVEYVRKYDKKYIQKI